MGPATRAVCVYAVGEGGGGISVSGIPERVGVALGQQGVPSLGPVIFVGVGAVAGGGGGSISTGSPSISANCGGGGGQL